MEQIQWGANNLAQSSIITALDPEGDLSRNWSSHHGPSMQSNFILICQLYSTHSHSYFQHKISSLKMIRTLQDLHSHIVVLRYLGWLNLCLGCVRWSHAGDYSPNPTHQQDGQESQRRFNHKWSVRAHTVLRRRLISQNDWKGSSVERHGKGTNLFMSKTTSTAFGNADRSQKTLRLQLEIS